jgi:hypothetical protein
MSEPTTVFHSIGLTTRATRGAYPNVIGAIGGPISTLQPVGPGRIFWGGPITTGPITLLPFLPKKPVATPATPAAPGGSTTTTSKLAVGGGIAAALGAAFLVARRFL